MHISIFVSWSNALADGEALLSLHYAPQVRGPSRHVELSGVNLGPSLFPLPMPPCWRGVARTKLDLGSGGKWKHKSSVNLHEGRLATCFLRQEWNRVRYELPDP